MKSAQSIVCESEDEVFVRDFDLREVDADPPTFWTRKWWARADRMVALIKDAAPPGSSVVDVGCAQGNLTNLLAEAGYRCVGVDLRLDFLRYAKKKTDDDSIAWVVANAQALPFEEGTFDVAILGEIIEHVAEPDLLMQQALRMVRPGGTVICTTPNGRCFRNADLPPYAEAAKDLDDLRARQFGPAGAGHLFALRPEEVRSLAPPGSKPLIYFAGSGLWNRALGKAFAASKGLSVMVDRLSMAKPWRDRLGDTLIVVLTRPND